MIAQRDRRQPVSFIPRDVVGEDSCAPAPPAKEQSLPAPSSLPPLLRALHEGWRWLQRHGRVRVLNSRNRRLRVSETVSLGEKRFLSIVEVDGASFLIGGSASNVALLRALAPRGEGQPFSHVLGAAWEKKESATAWAEKERA